MDDVRNGNFKLRASESIIIQRQCQISKAISKEYNNVEDAFNDWKDLQKTSVSIPQTNESERNLEYFKTVILEKGVIDTDQQKWILTKKENSARKGGNDRNDTTSTTVSHGSTPPKPKHIIDQTDGSVITQLKMIEQTGVMVNQQPENTGEAHTSLDEKVEGTNTALPNNANEARQIATQAEMVVEKVASASTALPNIASETSQAANQAEMAVEKVASASIALPNNANDASQAATQAEMAVEKVASASIALANNEASQAATQAEMVFDATANPTLASGPKDVYQDEMMSTGSLLAAEGTSTFKTEQDAPPERENIERKEHSCEDNSTADSESRKRPLEGNKIIQADIKRPAPN
eukprot:805920_1